MNVALAQRGVEIAYGAFDWDERFAAEGEQYAAFAETGLQIIGTDRPMQAARDLDAHDGEEGLAALQCATPRSMQ